MSVITTDKSGDHAKAGKIWENQFFTWKMDYHRHLYRWYDEGKTAELFKNLRLKIFPGPCITP